MLLLLSTVALAQPAKMTLRYTMTLDGQPIGHREVTVNTLGPDLRMLEVWTEGNLPLGVHFEQRLTGLASQDVQAFAAVNEESVLVHDLGFKGGVPSEVQLVRSPEGWRVTVAMPTGVSSSTYSWEQVDQTSLSLLDPGGVQLKEGQLELLSAETGELLSGPLVQVGAVEVQVGDQLLPGTAWMWTVEGTELELVYGLDGTPLRYRSWLLGQPVELVLDSPPNWDEALQTPMTGQAVQEEEL